VAWDRDRYLAEVLEPARKAGNVPPADLYVRYGLARNFGDQSAFNRQIAQALACWRELRGRRMYARLAESLIAAHADLEKAGLLTPTGFTEHEAKVRQGLLERLARLARIEAGAATHVGPDVITRLRDALGGAVSDADISSALSRAGVRIIEAYPALPAEPHPKQADLALYLKQLGVRLSAEVVFGPAAGRGFRILGGFRLPDGRTLTVTELDAARDRIAALPYTNPLRTPTQNTLAILGAAARTPGDLDTLLLSEVVEQLRELARRGFIQRAIAEQGRELGLDEDEAGRIAAAILVPDTRAALRQQVDGELARGNLRNAQRLSAGLPADDPRRDRIADADAEVTALTRRADTAEAMGLLERAAALLAEAIELARDDTGLRQRLASIPPPAPRDATARMDDNRVLISWRPSLAATGRVQYLVMRGRDQAPGSPAQGVQVVTRTERTDVIDQDAPAGAELSYSVFAARGGEAWSPPASTAPITFLPEVAEVSLTSSATEVSAVWRPHPGADAVRVVQREARAPEGPDDGTIVAATLTGFAATGLRSGTEYFYRIVTSYLAADGQRRRSAGVVVRAVPEPALRPVADLAITESSDGDPVFLARWTPPPYGRVRLVLSDQPLPWTAGTRLGPEEAAALPEVPGTQRRGTDGRDVLELCLPAGRHQVTPLTVGRNGAMVGHDTEAWLLEPVDGLRADRMGDEVQLGWIWPDHATDALVRWPGGERRCSWREYHDEGGFVITVGAAETTVEVRAVYPRRGGRLVSPVARAPVPARGTAVRYRILSAPRRRARERTFKLTTERAARLPALVIVHATGPYPPGDAYEGETFERRQPQDITPDQDVLFTVTVPKGPGWVACFVDPAAPDASARAILLYPPPREEMRIR
jgi:hypothetical protein